jgi:hypothetical protein
VILEFDVPSYRTEKARERGATSQEGKEKAKKQTQRRNRKE